MYTVDEATVGVEYLIFTCTGQEGLSDYYSGRGKPHH
jgi:hypothetical protein